MFASELDLFARRLTKAEAPRGGVWAALDPCPSCRVDVVGLATRTGPVCPHCRTSLRGMAGARGAAAMSLQSNFGGAQ